MRQDVRVIDKTIQSADIFIISMLDWQGISQDSVILRCLFDFSAQEKDELSVVENQVSTTLRETGAES
jgi:hypothetical protein